MVTPEMLLWLAQKQLLLGLSVSNGKCHYLNDTTGDFDCYEPHRDEALFGRLIVWAWQHGLEVQCCQDRIDAHGKRDDVPWWFNAYHDSTDDSIMAAAVVAICRALGWGDDQ